jgi:predicted phage tail protein
MTNISIEGHLAKVVGPKWELRVRNFVELFNAIEANTHKLRAYLNGRTGHYWAIFVNGEKVDPDSFLFQNIKDKNVKIIPLLAGGGPIVTAIVTAMGVEGTAAIILEFVISAIISMAISFGLSMLMAKLMKPDDPQAANTTSFIFGSPENVASQGNVVPVGYGRIKAGGNVISVSSSNVDRTVWDESDLGVFGETVVRRSPLVPSREIGGGSARTRLIKAIPGI